MSTPPVFDPQRPRHGDPEEAELGGKAWNLWRLEQAGMPVPRWIALTDAAFRPGTAESTPESLRAVLREAGLDHGWLAVRSSAAGEDGARFSFAGQLDTCLFVRPDDVAARAQAVWNSAFGARAEAYRRENRLEQTPPRAAVIVQRMIDAVAAGVAFGIDLDTGSRRGVTVSAVFGSGEGLVGGELDADTWILDADGNVRHRTIAHKVRQTIMAPEGGTRTVALDPGAADTPVLNETQLREVADAVRRISEQFGRPQDIEWARDAAGTLHILQARPVTSLARLADPDGLAVLWDNSNIVESYPGVTTPLTFSFIRGVYTEVYRRFSAMMGVEEELIEANRDAFEMLGLIRGRVYYNLLNWYKVLMLLPGYDLNAPFMEQMMGVKEPLAVKPEIVRSRRGARRRVAGLAGRMLVHFVTLERRIRRFRHDFDATIAPLEGRDFSLVPAWELIRCYETLESKLLPAWQPPLVNDFFAMIYYGALKKLLLRWRIDPNGTLQNNLLIGEGKMISTEPVRRLRALAGQIRDDVGLCEALTSGDPDRFRRALAAVPAAQAGYDDYIRRFGNRCIGELKLETVTYTENPALLIDILRCYVQAEAVDEESQRQRERELRTAAEAEAAAKLRWHPLRWLLYRHVLGNARRLVRNRENLRFERTRLFAVTRNIFLGFGKLLYREGILADPRDVFYLTQEEIFSFVKGTAPGAELAQLVEMRRAEFAAYRAGAAPAERFTTRGMVFHGNDFAGTDTTPDAAGTDATELKGLGCCGGIVRARVRVVTDPTDTAGLNGCILAAERTDPGWAPLFPVCRGVLVERGSILSHAAIVTRELGIPAIVGVRNLMRTLRDGEEIEMNGKTGVVRRLGAAAGTEDPI